MTIEKIIRNAIECPLCHDVIESKHRHDYVTCSCGSVSADGGHEYRKRSWKIGVEPIERSEVYEEEYVFPDYTVDASKENFDNFREDMLSKCDEIEETFSLKKKKTKYGLVTFTDGHIDLLAFAVAVNKGRKKPIAAEDVFHMYSDIERGRYGAGRRFWVNKEPKSEPVTVFMASEALRNRMKMNVKSNHRGGSSTLR